MDKEEFNGYVKDIAMKFAINVLKNENIDVDMELLESYYKGEPELTSSVLYGVIGNQIEDALECVTNSVLRDVDNWETHHMISSIIGICNISDDQVIRFMVNITVGTRYNVPVVSHSIDLKTGIVYKDDMGKEIGRIIDGKFGRTWNGC